MSIDPHELAGAYALDAVDDLERAAVEEHLGECAECRAEVASFVETAALLGSGPDVAPPLSLRESLLAQVATTPQQPRAVASQPTREAAPTEQPREVAAPTEQVADLSQERARRRGPARRAVLGLAAAAALAIGGGVAWQSTRPDTPADLTAAVLEAPDAQRVQTAVRGGGEVEIVRSAEVGRAVVIAQDLPAAGEGAGYQAWLQDAEGQMHPEPMLPADGTPVLLEGDARSAAGVGLTIEPAGGSPQPTSDPVALVTL